MSKQNVDMRVASGEVNDRRLLVAFLYKLMRDKITSGEVESIMDVIEQSEPEETQYTNGWLAKHAQDLASRLVSK